MKINDHFKNLSIRYLFGHQLGIRIGLSVFMILCSLLSCSRFVEVEPPTTSTNGEIIFKDDATAISAITSVYINMSKSSVGDAYSGWLTNLSFLTGLTGDELKLWNEGDIDFGKYYTNNISPEPNTWSNNYKMIFMANSAIEELSKPGNLTPAVQSQLLGEALFIRAFTYFYLVNIYGAIPLAVSTDYKINSVLPRSTVTTVYDQIIKDLLQAQGLLSDIYLDKDCISKSVERVRPTKWAATALLARTYLFRGEYSAAEREATRVIENTSLYKLVGLNQVFLMNSEEAIWQLQPVGTVSQKTANSKDGQLYNLGALSTPSAFVVYLRKDLVNSFDVRDQRKIEWIKSIDAGGKKVDYAFKYRIGLEEAGTQEYSTVIRLAELFLIRAESQIHQNKIKGGIEDLNTLRRRATNLNANSNAQLSRLPETLAKEEALLAVEDERRHELFTEWAHRWLDLKRTDRINDVIGQIKPSWQPTDQLFPLPKGELENNPNTRGQQNPGY